jgi:hypothetical protein
MDLCDHARITKKAISMYLQHAGATSNAHLFDDYKLAIVSGCAIEDVFPPYERLKKWHFFPENVELKSLGRRKALGITFENVDPTSRRLCLERADQLARECLNGPSIKLFWLVGCVLHHVQDMSTPPHVVPVYHEPFSRDSYESYSVKSTPKRLETVHVSSSEFSQLKAQLTRSFNLYDEAARATLDYIYDYTSRSFSVSINGEVREVGCDEFWKRCSQHSLGPHVKGGAGFGCYGSLGQHFGKTRFKRERDEYEVEAAVFERVHGDLVHKAVEDSLKVLMFADAELTSRT